MSRSGKTLGITLLALVLAIAILVGMVLQRGVSARATPTAGEEMLARTLRHFAVPVSARKMRNPLPLTAASLSEGREHFADHCAQCHANDGSGQSDIGRNLYPTPPDMRTERTQRLSDGELFYVIKNGVRMTGMPAWSDHGDEDNWKLVLFIRHLPKITPQEIEEMKKLNPISPHEREEQEFLEGEHHHEGH